MPEALWVYARIETIQIELTESDERTIESWAIPAPGFAVSRAVLGLIIVLGLLQGCSKPEITGGDGLLPEGDALSAFQTDTITLRVTSEREDSLRTDELSVSLIGSYIDPVFGAVNASAVTQVRLSASSAEFPVSYEIDSVVLALVYGGELYGQITNQFFVVNELDEDLFLDSNYYSNRPVALKPENLMKEGYESQKIRPVSYLQVTGDSIVPQLRLHLRESFGQHLMSPADPGVLSSDESFRSYLKGFQISTTDGKDGIFNVDLVDPDSKLVIYYRDLDGVEPDTTSYSFGITSDCARYTRLGHTYSGTALSGIPDGPLDGAMECYVQAGAGTKVRIEMPHLNEFNALEGRTINGAQLVIPFEDDARYSPLDQLVLLYEDTEGKLRVLPDQTSQSIGGRADFSDRLYRFQIGRYVQQVINGDIASRGLYLLSTRAGVSVNRVVCRGPDFSTNPNQRMRLILTVSSE
jgi:hypothetical protein